MNRGKKIVVTTDRATLVKECIDINYVLEFRFMSTWSFIYLMEKLMKGLIFKPGMFDCRGASRKFLPYFAIFSDNFEQLGYKPTQGILIGSVRN